MKFLYFEIIHNVLFIAYIEKEYFLQEKMEACTIRQHCYIFIRYNMNKRLKRKAKVKYIFNSL